MKKYLNPSQVLLMNTERQSNGYFASGSKRGKRRGTKTPFVIIKKDVPNSHLRRTLVGPSPTYHLIFTFVESRQW